MTALATPENGDSGPARQRRSYDSPLRRERAAQTRDRIVTVGSALVHGLPTWDWETLTFRAVAERAGISERTVYRHFPTERDLHDAVMQRLGDEAGVSYEGLNLDGIPDVMARSFATLSSFAVPRWTAEDPTQPALAAEALRRRDALLVAIAPETPDWSDAERGMAAAVLDVLWGVPALEHLVGTWQLDGARANRTLTWVIRVVVEAIRDDRRPAEHDD